MVDAQAVVADKAYDTNAIAGKLTRRRIEIVILAKHNRLEQRPYDENLYADLNKIERLFNGLKGYRHVATRHDKSVTSFLAFVHLACALIWLVQLSTRSTAEP